MLTFDRFRSLFLTISTTALMSGVCYAQIVRPPTKTSIAKLRTPPNPSHSKHGPAFDEGPRQKARLIPGMGTVHFPITTRSAEAQRFFDQGVNQLYSFFYYEAERSFRHALMLDPNCAMAYWGLAEADSTRAAEFLQQAKVLRDKVTDREKRYLDASAILNRTGTDEKARTADYLKALESLVLAYPDDLEAKVMLAWAMRREEGGVRSGVDALLRQVLAKKPNHPAAHHYRIHLWDGPDATNALDSCKAYPTCAPNIGHAQHMPGHIYAQLGMWEQASYAMDAAARVERRYFYEQGQMPYDSWNYAHDQHYLIANLGYLGRIEEGVRLAQELLDVPHDPKYNNGQDFQASGQGRFAMMRMCLRGERWDEIIAKTQVEAKEDKALKGWKLYTLGMAYLGKNNREEARKRLTALEELKLSGDEMTCAHLELRGRLAILDGKNEAGLEDLKKAVEIEKAKFAYSDPSRFPRPLYESLAWGYLQTKRPAEAETVLRTGLKREPNNGFALCLLLQSVVEQNKKTEVAEIDRQLRQVWKHADTNLPMLQNMQASLVHSGVNCSVSRKFAVPYQPTRDLERLGPTRWKPFPAPDSAFRDSSGKTIRLSDYRGKNLLLVFYLGGVCSECMKQLEGISKEKEAFSGQDTQILAISPDSPSVIKSFLETTPNYPLPLLSDNNKAAARKFKAYDEFENLSLHAIVLIDKKGNVWWQQAGSEPFSDFAFLKSEVVRLNQWQKNQP